MSSATQSASDRQHQTLEDKQTTYFRCIAGCPGKHSIYDVIYTCPICGSLLEVHHEREPLKNAAPRTGSSCLPPGPAPPSGPTVAASGVCGNG
jgi:hypothetical protein